MGIAKTVIPPYVFGRVRQYIPLYTTRTEIGHLCDMHNLLVNKFYEIICICVNKENICNS